MGVFLGLALRRVRVKPLDTPQWEGYAWFRFSPTKRLAYGVMCAAGAAADRIHYGRRFHHASAGDRELAASHGFTPREFRMLQDLAEAYLRGPLATKWEALAAALTERDLTGREVKAFVLHRDAEAIAAE